MDQYNKIHISGLLKTLFIKVFSSKYCIAILDLCMTTVIAVHTANIDLTSKKWITKLIIYSILAILINSICILADNMKNKSEKALNYYDDAYNIQSKINYKTATSLYRVNKKILESIRKGKIEKGALGQIADFQSLSFFVCNELYDFFMKYFNCGECEVTIFQRFTDANNIDFVKMIAYKNNKNSAPSSYGKKFIFSSNNKKPVFLTIFNDLNAEVKILHNRKAVESEFIYFEDSEIREKKICQYIGIPIKTNRNKIEILLQIDVTKEKGLGKKYNDLKQLSDHILLPFCNYLHCSYERDLICNKFYDILEENITKSI